MNGARIRRAEKVMAELDPITRGIRYFDALFDENPQADRLHRTVPPREEAAFRRASLVLARVVRHEPLAVILLLRVQLHMVTAGTHAVTEAGIDAWLDRTRGLWRELLAFEAFYKRATELLAGRSQPLARLGRVIRETRGLLTQARDAMAPELDDLAGLPAESEMVAVLLRSLLEEL